MSSLPNGMTSFENINAFLGAFLGVLASVFLEGEKPRFRRPVFVARHSDSNATYINRFATAKSCTADGWVDDFTIDALPSNVTDDFGGLHEKGFQTLRTIKFPEVLASAKKVLIVSSPKRRCYETAKFYAQRLTEAGAVVRINIVNDLDERDCGVVNGMQYSSVASMLDEIKDCEYMDQLFPSHVINGFETVNCMMKRSTRAVVAMEELAVAEDFGAVLLVTHWHICNVLHNAAQGSYQGTHRFIKPAEISELLLGDCYKFGMMERNSYCGLPWEAFLDRRPVAEAEEGAMITMKKFSGQSQEGYFTSEGRFVELTRRRNLRAPRSLKDFVTHAEMNEMVPVTESLYKYRAFIAFGEGYGSSRKVHTMTELDAIKSYLDQNGTRYQISLGRVFSVGTNSDGSVWKYGEEGFLLEIDIEWPIHHIANLFGQDRWTVVYFPTTELNKKPFSVTFCKKTITE